MFEGKLKFFIPCVHENLLGDHSL